MSTGAVKRVTYRPISPGGDYSGGFLVPAPISPATFTNGHAQFTNLTAGYAYELSFTTPFNTGKRTNYFPVGLSGAVNAVDYIVWLAGFATDGSVIQWAWLYNTNLTTGMRLTNGILANTTNFGITLGGGTNYLNSWDDVTNFFTQTGGTEGVAAGQSTTVRTNGSVFSVDVTGTLTNATTGNAATATLASYVSGTLSNSITGNADTATLASYVSGTLSNSITGNADTATMAVNLSGNITGEQVSSGTVADARIASTIARDSEVQQATNDLAGVLVAVDATKQTTNAALDALISGSGAALTGIPQAGVSGLPAALALVGTNQVVLFRAHGSSSNFAATANNSVAHGALLTNAQATAASGDTIKVGPGVYQVEGLGKAGVNWSFAPGAILANTNATGTIWNDKGAAISFRVDGSAQFHSAGGIAEQTAASTFIFELLSVTNAADITWYLDHASAVASVLIKDSLAIGGGEGFYGQGTVYLYGGRASGTGRIFEDEGTLLTVRCYLKQIDGGSTPIRINAATTADYEFHGTRFTSTGALIQNGGTNTSVKLINCLLDTTQTLVTGGGGVTVVNTVRANAAALGSSPTYLANVADLTPLWTGTETFMTRFGTNATPAGSTYTNNTGLPGVVVGSGIGTNLTTLATLAGDNVFTGPTNHMTGSLGVAGTLSVDTLEATDGIFTNFYTGLTNAVVARTDTDGKLQAATFSNVQSLAPSQIITNNHAAAVTLAGNLTVAGTYTGNGSGLTNLLYIPNTTTLYETNAAILTNVVNFLTLTNNVRFTNWSAIAVSGQWFQVCITNSTGNNYYVDVPTNGFTRALTNATGSYVVADASGTNFACLVTNGQRAVLSGKFVGGNLNAGYFQFRHW